MKKRIINLIILLSDTLFIFIIVTGKVNVECLFKKIFHISCPGCGLTRSFRSILNLDFINAFKYNILGIPLFILCKSGISSTPMLPILGYKIPAFLRYPMLS